MAGLLAERSKPHTGGMEGIYRRRLLENGAWLVLVRAVRVTNFQTAVLEETVAASLMYLAAEVPLMIAAGATPQPHAAAQSAGCADVQPPLTANAHICSPGSYSALSKYFESKILNSPLELKLGN